MEEKIFFKVDCEWLCNFVRQRVFWEGVSFTEGIQLLKESFRTDDATAIAILTGNKKVVGINGGDLVDDNKQKDYLDYVARTEKQTAMDQLDKDIDLHPFNYMDPFATRWSYREFKGEINKEPTFSDLVKYFGRPPCDGTITEGGLYSINLDFIWGLGYKKKITAGDEDQEEFYKKLYEYWEERLTDGSITSEFETSLIKKRQQVYLAWVRKKEKELEEEIAWITGKKKAESKEEEEKDKHPHWVLSKDKTYDLCKSDEAGGYQSQGKFVPCQEGVFTSYGCISPKGDFYACGFAGHETMAVVLAYQYGYFGKEAIPDDERVNPILYLLCGDDKDGVEFRHKAKDLLYDKGWVFINTAWGHGGTFYSKWAELEDMPQRVMDTAYDYIIAEREGRVIDTRHY